MITTFQAKVIKWETISLSLVCIEFELVNPPKLEFKSGQYIALMLPDNKGIRSYSISSSELDNNKIELTINIYDVSLGGAGVQYLSSLKVGDMVILKAPFGRMNLIDAKVLENKCLNPDIEEIIWIGTGSGIAPIKSMLEYLNYVAMNDCNDERLKKLWNKLYIGARFSGDVCYCDIYEAIKKTNPNFDFKFCLSKLGTSEDQGVTDSPIKNLAPGHVTELILKDTENMNRSKIHIFACGKTSTIQTIIQDLTSKGFEKSNFHLENFG